jgi:hypothetical protein
MKRGHAALALALTLAGGCGRKVVLDPAQAAARNDAAWTIRHPPGVAPAAAADRSAPAPPAASIPSSP